MALACKVKNFATAVRPRKVRPDVIVPNSKVTPLTQSLEAINHTHDRTWEQRFHLFLDVRKAFDTVWIDGLFLKLFFEFGIRGRMWLALRSLYTGMKAHVLCFGSLSRKFDILQGTGQGRLLAPFMHKVYINGLLTELTSHSCALSLNNLSLPSLSFLNVFMQICYDYSLKWRYEFNHRVASSLLEK